MFVQHFTVYMALCSHFLELRRWGALSLLLETPATPTPDLSSFQQHEVQSGHSDTEPGDLEKPF